MRKLWSKAWIVIFAWILFAQLDVPRIMGPPTMVLTVRFKG